MRIVLPGEKGSGPSCCGDRQRRVPAPRHLQVARRRGRLDEGTAAALAFRFDQSGIQRGMRQATRQQQPAVIGHDPHATPGADQCRNSIGKIAQADRQLVDHAGAEGVTLRIEIARLAPERPCADRRIARVPSGFLEQPPEHRLLRRSALGVDRVEIA